MAWQIKIPLFTWMNGKITRGILASHTMKIQIRHRMEAVPARIKVTDDGLG